MKKLLLIILVTVFGFAFEAPLKVNGATTIDSKLAWDMYNKSVKFLDVRPLKFVKYGAITGSYNIYVDDFSKDKLLNIVRLNEPVVVYCNGRGCPLSSEAIVKLVKYGYTNIYYYRDGIPAWKYYKLPIK